MPQAAPTHASLTAGKIVMMLHLFVAGLRCGEGVSVCAPELISGEVQVSTDTNLEYMCLDHTVGSRAMVAAQEDYSSTISEDVIFGIGSFGQPSDLNMGKCYKMYLSDVSTIVVGQVTNFGGDINEKQFDMQMGGGGFGVFNACGPNADFTATSPGSRDWTDSPCGNDVSIEPMLPPDNQQNIALFGGQVENDWGERCGGQTTVEGCVFLPTYPSAVWQPENMGLMNEKDNLQQLCEYAFNNNVRRAQVFNEDGVLVDGNFNHFIDTIVRIPCPSQLIDITNLQREDDLVLDENNNPTFDTEESKLVDHPNQKLTSTMDCCASASTHSSNTSGAGIGFVSGRDTLPSCGSTGY